MTGPFRTPEMGRLPKSFVNSFPRRSSKQTAHKRYMRCLPDLARQLRFRNWILKRLHLCEIRARGIRRRPNVKRVDQKAFDLVFVLSSVHHLAGETLPQERMLAIMRWA